MKKSSWLYIVLFIAIFWVTLLFFRWLMSSSYFIGIENWIDKNLVLFVIGLFFYKSLGLLWPPIPSGLFTLLSIPFIGWYWAYVIDLLGSLTGGSIAYFLGKKYGYQILRKIFDETIIERIKRAKIKKGREIEAVFMYKTLLGSIILEAIYYGAGVLNVPFVKFLIGAGLSHMAVGIPMFLIAENIFSGKNLLLVGILSIFAVIFVIKTKGRYFE